MFITLNEQPVRVERNVGFKTECQLIVDITTDRIGPRVCDRIFALRANRRTKTSDPEKRRAPFATFQPQASRFTDRNTLPDARPLALVARSPGPQLARVRPPKLADKTGVRAESPETIRTRCSASERVSARNRIQTLTLDCIRKNPN